MNVPAKEIISVSIEEELKRSYLDYAMSVIIGRALPDVRDGLKPVHRRILFAMNMLNNDWNKPYKKSARIVGDVIGKYHPHGDTAVYETIVRLAQPFSMRYTLIDGQGNFGSVDGDSAAAMRYTEIRMSKIAHELLSDLKKETVDFIKNYDGNEEIPTVMPTQIPNLLINGTSGIAVGMATNIPPHNIKEVVDVCLAYIKNKDISINDLMKLLPGPDFPTAAIINGQKGIEEAYRTGKGKIYLRARAQVKIDCKTGRETIVIYEIPYQVNKAKLIEKIALLIREKKLQGINGIRDESDKEGMRIIIEIKRDAIGEVILNKLYSLTKLQLPFSINMVALYNGKPKVLSLKEILSAFLAHRKEIVTRRTYFELNKAYERSNVLETLAVTLVNLDEIVDLIRKSSNPKEAKKSLMNSSWKINKDILYFFSKSSNNFLNSKKYYFSEEQAKTILDLRLHRFTSLEYEKLFAEYQEISEKILKFNNILKDHNCLIEVIRKELKEVKIKYGDPRRTKIISNALNINIEDLIDQEDVVITFSYNGYVKYQPLIDYNAQRRGGKGKSAVSIKETDFIDRILVANTHDTILLFSNKGRMYWMKVHQLPEASRIARGKPIINLLPLELNERITAVLPVRMDYEEHLYIFMATAKGIVKKTSLNALKNPRNTGIISIRLNKDDELIGVDLTNGNNEIMLFSSYGKVVRFKEIQVRETGRTTTGVRGINLSKGDKLVSLIIPKDDGQILTVTQRGYGKRTKQLEYPVRSRSTQGVIAIKINNRNGRVVGAIQVNDWDQIMVITDAGKLVRTWTSEINIIGRNTQGVRLIRTDKDEKVVSVQRITEPILNRRK